MKHKRELIYSQEYLDFAKNSNPHIQEKLLYATVIIQSIDRIPTKFVKKLVNTDFYEMRISATNAIRVIIFAIDNEDINQATKIVLLNAFVKKNTKDYKKQIITAVTILRKAL